MMRMMMAGLALLVAAPATAQDNPGDLPQWLVGTWCRGPDQRTGPATDFRWTRARDGQRPEWGGQCLTWTVKRDGVLFGRSEFGMSGVKNLVTTDEIKRVDGRLRYGVMWEVSRGPNELVFEGEGRRQRYVRDGDVLTFTLETL